MNASSLRFRNTKLITQKYQDVKNIVSAMSYLKYSLAIKEFNARVFHFNTY